MATLFVSIILALIVFLTQSLRFLDIVLDAGSSGSSFWILTLLALPRFFEIILPLAIVAATLFIYNKMTIDSELIAIRATGASPFSLARPALILGLVVTIILWALTMWIAPASMARMQKMRLELTGEFSALLFKEGVFNPLGDGLTVYIRQRTSNGEMLGLMIHDARAQDKPPSTILAKRGKLQISNDLQQVVVFNGTRQVFTPQSGILQRLNFDRYTIDLPKNNTTGERWAEPDERTFLELLHPNLNLKRDQENLHNFTVEIHRRITGPLLALAFPVIALAVLLNGAVNRRGNIHKIFAAIGLAVILQGLFLTASNLARSNDMGIALMYILTIAPLITGLFFLSGASEDLRRRLFFKNIRRKAPA